MRWCEPRLRTRQKHGFGSKLSLPGIQRKPSVPKALVSVLVLVVCTLNACYPVRGTYFAPNAQWGTVRGIACKGQAGFPENLEIETDGATISILALKLLGLVQVLIYPRQNVSVAFRTDGFLISVEDTGKQAIRPTRIEAYRQGDYFNKLEIPVAERQIVDGTTYRAYHVTFTLPTADINTFELQVPIFSINGQDLDLSPVRYETKSGWFILPLNC